MAIDAKDINADLNRRIGRTRSVSRIESQKPSLDLGEGLSANAQREIIEVMLAEPKLFGEAKKSISPEDFDIPAFRLIAEAIFGVLAERPQASVNDICGCVDEPQVAGLIIALENDGLQKGNFSKRLADALTALEQARLRRDKNAVNTGDGREFIRTISQRAPRQDPRNVGMT
jgi:hypothetical protein